MFQCFGDNWTRDRNFRFGSESWLNEEKRKEIFFAEKKNVGGGLTDFSIGRIVLFRKVQDYGVGELRWLRMRDVGYLWTN